MSASEVDHNYHHRRQQQSKDQLQQPPQPPTLLPATTYSHPSRPTHPLDPPPLQRSSTDWASRQPNISHTDPSSISNSHNEPDTLNDSPSTDPSDFYRHYRDPFQYDAPSDFVAHAGSGNNRFSDRADDEMIAASSTSYFRESRISSSKRGTTTPPRSIPRQYRSTSTTSNTDDPPFSPSYTARPNPAAAVVAGSRRTSLKELVNKFNQTPDEVPPVPSRPTSRAPSRAVSPSGGATTSRNRAWSRSQSNSTVNQQGGPRGRSETNRYPPTTRSSSFYQKQDSSLPNGEPDTTSWVRQTKRSRSSVGAYGIDPPGLSNQADVPRPLNTSRRPLFGELLPVKTSAPDTGYGLPPQRGRRGSEGSINTPSPMFRSQFDSPTALSPSSPTAWYLGYTPSLETVNFDSTTNPHRRSQSDFTQLNPSILSPLNTQLMQMAQMRNSPTDINSANSNEPTSARANTARSRIPVASRRLSQTSDSGNSTPSTRANSALGRHSNQYPTPRKGASALPKPASKPSSPSSTTTTVPATTTKVTPVKSNSTATAISRRRDANQPSPLQLDKSPSLKAYISAPPAKKSPQLRSSRPRQPVSTATTSSSRAKVVDRVSSLQSKHNTEPKSPRRSSRRLPELGNVDFAARRQRIQQAFNKTVQENEKKEEEDAVERRRLAKEKEDQEKREQAARQEEEARLKTEPDVEGEAKVEMEEQVPITVSVDRSEVQEPFPETESEFTMEDAPLTLDTTSLAQAAQDTGSQELLTSRRYEVDSPTLGVPGPLSEDIGVYRALTPVIDNQPVSAITVDTIETVGTDVTTFDTEPQTDPPQNIHRTVLSQIMQMRESSSSETSPTTTTSSSGEPDISLSERSDKESIQIMFRDSLYYDSMDSSDSQEEQVGPIDDVPADAQISRWSMCSWSSSMREPPSDGPLESIREVASPAVGDEPHPQGVVSTEERNNGQTPRPWSPSTASPPPSRSTLDVPFGARRPSESSSSKHRPSSRGSLESYQQQILSKSPDLAKQGGWDSKRVTQLYLQELARGRFEIPFPGDNHHVAPPESKNEPTSHPKEKDPSKPDGLTEDPVIVPESKTVPRSDYMPHRASLNHREDWERASPSISDWMTFMAADDIANSPISKTGFTPTQKFPGIAPDREGAETPRNAPTENQSDMPKGGRGEEGLGLSIHVHSPQGEDALPDTVPPPPIPDHSPPPPPTPAPAAAEQPSSHPPVEVSPSIYSTHPSHPPSSVLPSGPPPPPIPTDYSINTSDRSSEESSLRHTGLTPSTKTQNSSATSVDQPSLEQPAPTETAPPAKATPSPEQRRLKKRRHVIKELVDTEHVFGRDMKVVDDIYKGTSSSCLDLSADDVKTLFGNSDQVVQFSMDFLDALKKASKSVYVMPKSQRWQSIRKSKSIRASTMLDEQASAADLNMTEDEKDRTTSIGEAFMAYVPRMEKVYADYLKNHDAANKKLEALQRNQKVSIWLKECREWASDLTTAWDLDSLLVKPVQRILKYPLLLAELRDATPADHPDHEALANALREMTSISVRINDSKKRADLVGQVVSSRKRKESDVRAGLSKAFGRRTEKLKQHVGFSEMFEDKDYDALSQTFGDSFFQLQVVMRDVEFYTSEVQTSMNRFNEFILAIEAFIDVGPSNYPEMESKWRRFRMAVKEVVAVALQDHIASVRKSVIEPMITLLKLHDGPQKVMQKRNKRLMDYARFKATKDRGDKPDKKTTEQGEQFIALNVTLKEELPKLFTLTAKLMEACLHNFVHLQTTWFNLQQKKLGYTIDRLSEDLNQIISDWSGDFAFSEAQVLSLGVCNGSLLAEAINLVNFNTPANGADVTSPPRTSTLNSSSNPRTTSFDSGASPKISYDLGSTNGSFMNSPSNPADALQQQRAENSRPNSSHRSLLANRTRTNSGLSGRGTIPHPHAETIANSQALQSMTSPRRSNVQLDAASGRLTNHESPSLPRLSLDTPSLSDLMPSAAIGTSNEVENNAPADNQPSSPNSRYTGFFSSAMPMPDSPRPSSPSANATGSNQAAAPNQDSTSAATAVPGEDPTISPQQINVLFIAASMFEFNIDRARREAGYPYLTYVTGEIFDVIAEKGELWLAKNQDDSTNQIGWIWNKHFAKLPSRS
ncbi:hypothetical protein FQN54_006485 [Arachnomyces sp. PD_36]|nr:hypothetical protein FQN54_006485 [Arachnomyces sp. PD_36]